MKLQKLLEFKVSSLVETDLNKHEIHVWQVSVKQHLCKIEDYFTLLSSDEKQQAAKFIFSYLANQYIIRRGVLRVLLSSYLRIEPNAIKLTTFSKGKPCLDMKESDLFFNLSYSEELICYAISRDPNIGIDIEYVCSSQFEESLLELVLHKDEYPLFIQNENDQKVDLFYQFWTAKEALVKAEGEGLYHPLTEIKIQFPNSIEYGAQKWALSKLELPKTYCGYVAASHPITSITYYGFLT